MRPWCNGIAGGENGRTGCRLRSVDGRHRTRAGCLRPRSEARTGVRHVLVRPPDDSRLRDLPGVPVTIESMVVVLHHSTATGAAKLILLGVANHDGDGGSWPSLRTLSRYANVNQRNVRAALRRLEDLGELRIKVQAGGRPDLPDHRRPNYYEVLVTCPESCDRSPQHRDTRTTDQGIWAGRHPRSPATPAPRSPATPEPYLEPTAVTDRPNPGREPHSSHGEYAGTDELQPAGPPPPFKMGMNE